MRWTSFGLGAGSLVFFWIPLMAFPASIAAVVLGIIAIAKGTQRRLAGASDGPAIFGIMLGCIALLISGIVGLIVLISVALGGAIENMEPPPQPINYDYTTM